MTENAACSHGNYPNNIKFGYVGKAMPNTDVEITEKGEAYEKMDVLWKGIIKNLKKQKKLLKMVIYIQEIKARLIKMAF